MLREAINSFLNYLTVEKGFSENTIVAYRNDLYQLATFVEEEVTRHGLTPSWSSFGRQGMLSYLLNLRRGTTRLPRQLAKWLLPSLSLALWWLKVTLKITLPIMSVHLR